MTIVAHASISAAIYWWFIYGLWTLLTMAFPSLSAIASHMPYFAIVLSTLGAAEGILPDVIGWAGRAFAVETVEQLRALEIDEDESHYAVLGEWDIYGSAHGGAIAALFRSFPAYRLHVWIDKHWHKPSGGWYWWGYVVEVAFWIAVICIILVGVL